MTPPQRKRVSTTAWCVVGPYGRICEGDLYKTKPVLAEVSRDLGYRLIRCRITEMPPKKRAKGKGKS